MAVQADRKKAKAAKKAAERASDKKATRPNGDPDDGTAGALVPVG